MDFLLDNFKHLTTTPKNVEQLKKLVLQIAAQGNLTVKWREDNLDLEPASVLLKKIITEKEQLIKDGRLPKEKPLPKITEAEKPFILPENWIWTRLGNIAYGFDYGTSSKSKIEGQIPVLRMGNIQDGQIDWNKLVYTDDLIESEKYLLRKNDILFNRTNSRELVGKTALFDSHKKSIFAGYLVRFSVLNGINPIYTNYLMNSPFHRDWCNEVKSDAIGQSNINATKLRYYCFPLAPLAEQKAIVSKVQSLFAQIDQLHELAKKNKKLKEDTAKALFGKVNSATDEQELQQTWQLLKANFNTVTQGKEGVKQLRQTILQLAVQGKLTAKWREENPDVEPASVLLEKIKVEKEFLIKEGKLRREKSGKILKEDEIPFAIPKLWKWERLSLFCTKIGSGSTPNGSNYTLNGKPFFRSQNIYNHGLVYDDIKFISEDIHKKMKGTIVYSNDILLNITGGSMGRCALVPRNFDEGNVSQHVCIIRPILINNQFFHKLILSPFFQRLIFSSTSGNGREGLPKYNLEQFLIPIPPFTEQQVIVSKVNQLMALCDELEKKIEKRDSYQERIMQAVVKQAI